MNDIAAILTQIDESARQAREETLAAAGLHADAIRAQGRRQAEEESRRILDEAERQADFIRRRGESQAGIQGRSIRLAARREVMDRAFNRAMDLLCALSSGEKAALYTRLAAQSLRGDALLILNEADGAAVGDEVARALSAKGGQVALSPEPGAFRGGLVLRQGSIETNCTFEVLVAGTREQTEAQVALVLFP